MNASKHKASATPSLNSILSTQEELEAYIPYLLNRLTSRWNIDQNRDLANHGINGTILRTLSVLFIHKSLTVNQIARLAVVEQSNASRTIDAMTISGLVERRIAVDDLRRRKIIITRKGEELLKSLWPAQLVNYRRLISNISEDNLRICALVLISMLHNVGEDTS